MSDEKPSIEERIRTDVESILIKTGRTPKLVYLVSQVDADTLIPGDIAAPARFQLATSGGMVGVAVDRWCPIGSVHRAYECSCGALFVDDRSRSGKCAVCMMASVADEIRKGWSKHEEQMTTGQQYGANLNTFLGKMRDEYGTTATISTTCARCSATIDPAGVEQHHERCFVAGDRVLVGRCDHDRSSEGKSGTVSSVDPEALRKSARYLPFSVRLDMASPTHGGYVWCEDVRHIQRPGQCEYCKLPPVVHAVGRLRCGHGLRMQDGGPSDAELQDAMEQTEPLVAVAKDGSMTARHVAQRPGAEPIAAPTLYDGLTAMECYAKWGSNRAAVECGVSPLYHLTPDQIAAGRRAYQMDALNEHADELRARISAAKERERLSVCAPDDDLWLANCRDAE